MTARTPAVRLDVEGGLGIITLARPAAANSVDRELASDFRSVVTRCEENRSIKVVLIRAEGRFFCGGGDVAAFSEAGREMSVLIRSLTADLHDALSRLSRMRKVVVTAVQGPAAGAGVGIALAGDIVVASETAHFTLAYTAIGLTPDAGATWILPRLVGVRRALEIALLNPRVTAAQALEMGLITRVVAHNELDAHARQIAQRLASEASEALGMTRALIRSAQGKNFDDQLAAESRAISQMAGRNDAREGISAFLEKRPPIFGKAGE